MSLSHPPLNLDEIYSSFQTFLGKITNQIEDLNFILKHIFNLIFFLEFIKFYSIEFVYNKNIEKEM